MPSVPNQSPSLSQEVSLSVNRVSSTIPKGGTEDDTWTYPSPQMVCTYIYLCIKMYHSFYIFICI